MKARTPVTLVLCEGKDDKSVMEHLAASISRSEHLEFESYDGADKLREYLKNLVSRPEFSRGQYRKILITRDADQEYAAAWQSIKDSVLDVFSIKLSAAGEWSELEAGSKVSGWVIPGLNQIGMIETLCLNAIRAKNPEQFTCLDSFIDCLRTQWGQAPHEKVRFSLWTILAQGKHAKERLSLSYAIKNMDFNWDHPSYDDLKELYRRIE